MLRYRNLTQDEALVFSHIESAGRDGIWTKTIRSRSNLHQIPLNKSLKSLEVKNLIKQTQNARFPNRKLYILSTLQPNEEVSGGPFYSDGSIDEDLIHYANRWLYQTIQERSWIETRSAKRKRTNSSGAEGAQPATGENTSNTGRIKYLPQPPGYTGYVTVGELARGWNESGLSTIKLKEAEVEHLLDLLRWDGRIEKAMGGEGFKTVRRPDTKEDEGGNNEMTETPCGRCPNFDLCDETGPVNATTCEYFPEWFKM